MTKTTFKLSSLIILASVLAVATVQAEEKSASGVETIEVTAAQDYVAGHDNAIIMAVRTPVPYDMSHITCAYNVIVQDHELATTVSGLL